MAFFTLKGGVVHEETTLREVVCIRVTGILRSGRRFKALNYPATANGWRTAMQINLWSGTRWAIFADGTKKRISHTAG